MIQCPKCREEIRAPRNAELQTSNLFAAQLLVHWREHHADAAPLSFLEAAEAVERQINTQITEAAMRRPKDEG